MNRTSKTDARQQGAAATRFNPGAPFSGKRDWIFGLGLVLAVIVAYQPAWHAGFIWDDDDHLTANPAMTAPDGLRMIWSSLAVSRYYPLTLTSFWVQRRLWGLNPLPYHLVNIALNAINGLMVFLVLRRLRVTAAWLAAAVWVLHPVIVESVAWITELKNTQSGFFFLGALLCFLRFEAKGQPRWYVLALLCGACALLSKASTVVLPFALLLCVWWERGSWRLRDIGRIVPFFVLALPMSVLAMVEQRGHIARQGTTEWSLGIGQRFIVAGKAIWFYLGKVVWPVNLAFVYPRWEVATDSAGSYLPLAGVLAGGVILWTLRRQPWARAGLFGFGFFVVALLPVLGFVDVFYFRYSFVADHFQYLASLGVIACATSGITYAVDRSRSSSARVGNIIYPALLVTLAGLTWRQNQIYHDPETLWRDTLAKNPNAWMVHYNLGEALWQAGRREESITQYEQALELNPDYAEAHFNLGFALVQLGKVPEGIGQYEQALRINPDYAEAHYNLGDVLWRTGQIEGAIREYEQALRVKPDYAKAHNNLGVALVRLGRFREAIGHYQQVVRLTPGQPAAHFNLGTALLQVGKPSDAAAQFTETLQLKPDDAAAHCNLGSALLQLGRVPEAIEQFQETLRLQPDYPDAHFNLGNALAASGKLTDAREQYEQALRRKPNDAEAHNDLGLVLFQLGKVADAKAQYEAALRINSDCVDAHYNLGIALEQTGEVREAMGHYEQALRIKPDLAKVRNALTRLQARQ